MRLHRIQFLHVLVPNIQKHLLNSLKNISSYKSCFEIYFEYLDTYILPDTLQLLAPNILPYKIHITTSKSVYYT